jgi:transposase-like protein
MAPRKTSTKAKAVTQETPEIQEIPETKVRGRKPRAETAPETKANVAVAAIIGERTVSEIAEEYGVEQASVNLWKTEALKAILDRFENPPRKGRAKVSTKESNRTASVLASLKTLREKKQKSNNGSVASYSDDSDDEEFED